MLWYTWIGPRRHHPTTCMTLQMHRVWVALKSWVLSAWATGWSQLNTWITCSMNNNKPRQFRPFITLNLHKQLQQPRKWIRKYVRFPKSKSKLEMRGIQDKTFWITLHRFKNRQGFCLVSIHTTLWAWMISGITFYTG